MSRIQAGTWVWDRDLEALVPKYGRNYQDIDEKRSDFPSPAIRPDGMSAIKSMADGRVYDGKSAYYQSVKRAGAEIVGTMDPSTYVAKPRSEREIEREIASDVQKAIQIEASKMPPAGGLADRRLMRKQRRKERETTC